MSSPKAPRQPRLRASCDGCFLAKVKCSKARPICLRCLQIGLECRYSPSTRAGKPKASEIASRKARAQERNQRMAMLNACFPYGSVDGLTSPDSCASWDQTLPDPMDTLPSNSSITANIAYLEIDEHTFTRPMHTNTDNFHFNGVQSPWTPPYSDVQTCMPSLPPAQMENITTPWIDASMPDVLGLGEHILTPVSVGSNYFPSPTTTEAKPVDAGLKNASQQVATDNIEESSGREEHGCECFDRCLQSLRILHDVNSPDRPAFDKTLSVNKAAVEAGGCLMACSACMDRSGSFAVIMLLGSVFGSVNTSYQHEAQNHFAITSTSGGASHWSQQHSHMSTPMTRSPGTMAVKFGCAGMISEGDIVLGLIEHNSGQNLLKHATSTSKNPGLSVSLGVYQLEGEDGRWLELEILAREVRKLSDVYEHFQGSCSKSSSEDAVVAGAVLAYLGQSIRETSDIIALRRVEMGMA